MYITPLINRYDVQSISPGHGNGSKPKPRERGKTSPGKLSKAMENPRGWEHLGEQGRAERGPPGTRGASSALPRSRQGRARSRGEQSAHLRGWQGGGKAAPDCAGAACATPTPRITPATAIGEGEKGRNDRQHGPEVFPPITCRDNGSCSEEIGMGTNCGGGGGASLQSVPIIIVRLRWWWWWWW